MNVICDIRCIVQLMVYWLQKPVIKKKICQDMERYGESHLANALLKHPNFRASFYFRLENRFLRKLCKITLAQPFNIELWGDIDGGLLIYHKMGCTILVKSMGANCTILQGVTIGKGKHTRLGNIPVIGNNVTVYTNAVVIGGIKIGDNAVIAAGAVVTHDVPMNAVVGGVPARVMYIKDIESEK